MPEQPSEKAQQRMRVFVEKYCEKSGTHTHPDKDVTVILGLAKNVDELGRPLCPCRFYPSVPGCSGRVGIGDDTRQNQDAVLAQHPHGLKHQALPSIRQGHPVHARSAHRWPPPGHS